MSNHMSPTPIFILGIAPRSGTNYLRELLTLHPECARSTHVGEDFLIQAISDLIRFVTQTTCFWNPSWGNDSGKLRFSLGYGLATYLTPQECSARYVVTKTPSCKNAGRFSDFFADARVIIIIRKGQDVVESFLKSFPSDFGYAARLWAQGAAEVLHITQNTTLIDSGRVMVVRYEELYQHNKDTMQKILDFLGLDAGCFDFEKSSECPVIGSSTYRRSSANVSWSPVAKGEGFAPLTRSSHWSRFRHYRFNWIAGELATRLGYTLEFRSRSPMYLAYNVAASLAETPRRTFRALRAITKGGRQRRKGVAPHPT
jgi:hypothetical protein